MLFPKNMRKLSDKLHGKIRRLKNKSGTKKGKWDKRVSAKICGFLRFSAKFCEDLCLKNALIPRKSERKTTNLAPFVFVPFSLSLLLPLDQQQKSANNPFCQEPALRTNQKIPETT